MKTTRLFRKLFILLLASLAAVIYVYQYRDIIVDKLNITSDTVYLSGTGSMYPTFPKGQTKTYSELRKEIVGAPQMRRYPSGFSLFGKAYFSNQLERGDIVSFENEKSREITEKDGEPAGFVKRIIALPGDQLEIRDGNVILNGQIISEPYIAQARSTFGDISLSECQILNIPDGHVFVMGDNRKGSLDSRHELGLVKISDIDHVIPFIEQFGTLDKNWRDTSTDTLSSSKIKVNKEKYLQLLNEKRKERDVPLLKYNPLLEKSAELRGINILKYDDKSFDATKSGYTAKKAMNDVGYKNTVLGEIPVYGHYDENELLENQLAFFESKEFVLEADFDDIGISEVTLNINNCPTQIVVIHFGGYIPPNYSADDIQGWKNLIGNLENIAPSWKELENSPEIYSKYKNEIDRINELITLRLQIARNVLLSLEKNIWLTDEQRELINKDEKYSEELNSLTKKINSS